MTTALEPELSTFRWSSNDPADRFPVEDPATGEVITLVQGGGAAEVDAAVEAAHRAFQTDWRWRPPAERAALLLKAADVLAGHADELALLESRENRKPVQDARVNDINFLIYIFRFFGSLVDKLPTDFYDKGAIYTSTYLEPVGVVGEIIPFNWPPIHAGGKMAPALAAGNTVVIKPSEQDPLTVMRIVELLNTVLPDDVLHAVPGTGSKVGQPLAAQAPLPDDPELANGFWVAPTLFTDVTRDMRIATEEIFGPVVAVERFSDEDDAVAIANEGEYGLTSAIYTAHSARGFRLARRIEVGMVFINNYFRSTGGTPFGGTKHSGYGREHAIETLREFGYTKIVRFPSGLGTIPAWRALDDIFEEPGRP